MLMVALNGLYMNTVPVSKIPIFTGVYKRGCTYAIKNDNM